jgi:hypothetical protein
MVPVYTHLTFEKRKTTILDIQLHTYIGKCSKANHIKKTQPVREGLPPRYFFLRTQPESVQVLKHKPYRNCVEENLVLGLAPYLKV